MKLHYLAEVLKLLIKELAKGEEKKEDTLRFEPLLKKLLIGRKKDGFEEHLNAFICDSVKSFPYADMPLFHQLCRSLTHTTEVWAMDVLSGVINGQRAFSDDRKLCTSCGVENDACKRCAKCKSVQYCDRVCQRLQWPTHKKFCDLLRQKHEAKEKELEH